MNIQEIKSIIPEDLADDSRAWVFQSSRPFNEQQSIEIKEQLNQFVMQWNSHGAKVNGWADLLFNRFIVLIADEKDVQVGGCSGDSMDRVIKSIERQYDTKLFDRLSITFLIKDKPEVLPMNQVQYAIEKGFVNGETLMFNNTVQTKKELLEKWLQPLSESWLSNQVALT